MTDRELIAKSEDYEEDTEVAIRRTTLEGLRDAYIRVCVEPSPGPGPYDALESWIEGVLDEAGMSETVRQAIQADWEERRKRRAATIEGLNP